MADRHLEYVLLDELPDAARNPHRHAAEVIEASITRFGFVDPPEVDERTGRLVAGHGRKADLLARHGRGDAVPDGIRVDGDGRWLVPVVRGWASKDDADAEAYLIASNRPTELATWEPAGLAELLTDLSAAPLGLDGTGYSTADLDELLVQVRAHERHAPADVDPDEVPPEPVEPVTKRGDLWVLGDHRLLCGDATVREDYDRVLGSEHPVGAVVSDPPYGVGIGAKNRALDSIDRADRVLTDLEGDQGIEEVEALWRASFGVLFDVMPKGTPYYINGPQRGDLGLLLLLLLRDAGLAPRHILIWVKNRPSFSIGRLDYDYQHEPIVYGWKPGGPHPWFAEETQTSVFHVDRPQASPEHPTVKPVELLVQLISNSTRPGQMVLDPFGGSGSTLIACEQTGRKARMLELSPGYTDVICRRYERVTGEKPVLEATGEPHSFIDED